MYNQTKISQLGKGRVIIEHNNKLKMCNFFIVPGNGQALLAMPNLEKLNILTISCNTIGTEEAYKDANCSTNTSVTSGAGCEQWYGNIRSDTGEPDRACTNTNSNSNCYTNTGSNSNLNSSNTFMSMANNNKIEFFFQALRRWQESKHWNHKTSKKRFWRCF